MVTVTGLIIITLSVILLITWFLSYLLYVRMRQLEREVEEIRARVNVTEGELRRMETSIKDIDLEF